MHTHSKSGGGQYFLMCLTELLVGDLFGKSAKVLGYDQD
jgi:hypothetical protein